MKSNFFPLHFDFDEFHIQRLPYQKEVLDRLRQQHNATHSFFRRDDFIYISPGTETAATLGDVVRLSINEHPEVVASLIRHIFFRAIKDKVPGLLPSFHPFTFPAKQDKYDLALAMLPERLQNIITYKRITEVQLRYNEAEGKPQFVAVVNHRYQWTIDHTCEQLVNQGLDILGLEVNSSTSPDYSDGVVAPELTLLGRVMAVDGDHATVGTNQGPTEYALADLTLFKSKENIIYYLGSFVGEGRAEQIVNHIKQDESRRLQPDVVMREIEEIGGWLSRLTYRNFDSFCFSIGTDNAVPAQAGIRLEEPKLIFDVSSTNVHATPTTGLNTFGPYSRSTSFDVNSPKVLVVFHQRNTGHFTEFLAQLKGGIAQHAYFANGMVRKYGLTTMEYRIAEITDYTVPQYLAAINKLLRAETGTFDIAIIETCENFRQLPPVDNPYFQVKSLLYSHGISTQFIRAETAQKPTYSIDSIALQMYAKLGGTPWTVPTGPSVDHELVIGIGSSILRSNQYAGATQARIVGISTFFSADGKYISNRKTQDVPYDQYFDELLQNLKVSINEISNNYSWSPGDRIRIIFHIFKPIKHIEADVVASLMEQYQEFDIKFAFVTFSEFHPYVLFNENERGEFDNYRKIYKGTYVPWRGYNVLLDPRSCLVQMLGPHEMKTSRHGASRPVLVRIHRSSTFVDLTYVVQQAFKFTRLSFRTFYPAHSPVTLLYSNMLARQLKDLRGISSWNYDVASRQLRHKKWFL